MAPHSTKNGRRAFLASLAALAGCTTASDPPDRPTPPPPLSDRPTGVYVPPYASGVRVVDTASASRLRCALAVAHPLRFWVVTGTRTSRVAPNGDLHLLAVVWDADSGRVLPAVAPRLTVTRAGDTVYDAAGWPMLSQRLGFHYGDNVALAGPGTYDVRVETPAAGHYTRGLAGLDTSATFRFSLDAARTPDVSFLRPENAGEPGALPARNDSLPHARVPPVDDLPGTRLGRAALGDAVVAATVIRESALADGAYVAVSPRTPYHRYPLPFMTLFGTLRASEVRFDGTLTPRVDPVLGYHYGARVPRVESGDEFVVGIGAPTQAARHEGYETAFMQTHPINFTA